MDNTFQTLAKELESKVDAREYPSEKLQEAEEAFGEGLTKRRGTCTERQAKFLEYAVLREFQDKLEPHIVNIHDRDVDYSLQKATEWVLDNVTEEEAYNFISDLKDAFGDLDDEGDAKARVFTALQELGLPTV